MWKWSERGGRSENESGKRCEADSRRLAAAVPSTSTAAHRDRASTGQWFLPQLSLIQRNLSSILWSVANIDGDCWAWVSRGVSCGMVSILSWQASPGFVRVIGPRRVSLDWGLGGSVMSGNKQTLYNWMFWMYIALIEVDGKIEGFSNDRSSGLVYA